MNLPTLLRITLVVASVVFAAGLSRAAEPITAGSIFSEPNPTRIRLFASPEEMHARYTEDFASRPGFGKSRIVFLPPQDFLTLDGLRYRFETPALLGLDGPPAAYVSHGPLLTVDDLSSQKRGFLRIQKRALSSPEREAADQLRAGADLVQISQDFTLISQGTTNSVRGLLVVGALRVRTQCAGCHQKPEGTLLGAFAYSLLPEPENHGLARLDGSDASITSCP